MKLDSSNPACATILQNELVNGDPAYVQVAEQTKTILALLNAPLASRADVDIPLPLSEITVRQTLAAIDSAEYDLLSDLNKAIITAWIAADAAPLTQSRPQSFESYAPLFFQIFPLGKATGDNALFKQTRAPSVVEALFEPGDIINRQDWKICKPPDSWIMSVRHASADYITRKAAYDADLLAAEGG